MDQDNETIVLPLNETIDLLLGDNHYRVMPRKFAEQLYAKCRNKRLVFVQFPEDKHAINILNHPITAPVVWRLHHYRESTEAWLTARKRSEEDRRARFVFDANVRIALRAIQSFSELDEKFALPLAIDKVKKNQEKHIIAMGGKPFYKSFDELP